MSDFLPRWEDALRQARESGRIAFVTDMEYQEGSRVMVAVVRARTMHPSFMALPMPKHDPERDQ